MPAIPPTPSRRILFVSHEASRTGAPMFLLHFLRWLRAHTNLSIDILLGKKGPLETEFAKLGRVYEPASFLGNARALQAFDLIYANTSCNGALIETLPYGNVPIVTHVHELDYGYDSMGAAQWAEVVRQTHRYIACARAVAERLEHKFNIPADRIGVHYEMIDPARLSPGPQPTATAALRERHGIPDDAAVLVACGTVDLRKGADLFVQLAAAMQRLMGTRPLRCLWIGKATDENLERVLRQDVRRLGLQQEIVFTGELEHPHELLALGDVFCLISREDPFPLAMLEAAALEKPVVCFAGSGGAGEFCAHGGGIAVPFLDVVAMADVCSELLADAHRRAELGRRAGESVRRHFAVDRVAPNLWREIEAFLATPAPPPEARVRNACFADVFRTWNPADLPDPKYVRLYLERHEGFAAAQSKLAAGRSGEAMGILLNTVRTVMNAKMPIALLEGLAEVSEEMAPLDAVKARYFRTQAETLAVKSGARIEFRPGDSPGKGPRRVRVLPVSESEKPVGAPNGHKH